MKRLGMLLGMVILALLAGCALTPAAPGAEGEAADVLHVTVSVPPQQYFVERIGGSRVRVTSMVPAGTEPHTYEPSAAQMRALSQADLYLTIGEGFEQTWMDRFRSINPDMQVVATHAGIERVPEVDHGHEDGAPEDDEHEDDDEHENDERTLDPHIWVAPRLVAVQAQTIHAAIVALDPAHQAEYDTNLAAFLADIETLDAEIRASLDGAPRRRFIVFHPAWGYFARDYGLEQIPVEVGGQEPSASELAEVIRLAREEGIRVILAQPEFSTVAAETIAHEIDGEVLLVSPLAQDWLDNMRRVQQAFATALEE
jgi:zinc transport system substrate-binding protein